MFSSVVQSLVLSLLPLGNQKLAEGDIPSSQIRSADLQLSFAIIQKQGVPGVTCAARIQNDNVHWDENDRMTCMIHEEFGELRTGANEYNADGTATLPFFPNETYTVRLERANGEVVESQIIMPGDSKILSPENHHIFRAGEEMLLRWQNPKFATAYGSYVSFKNENTGKACNDDKSFKPEDKKDSYRFPAGNTLRCGDTDVFNAWLLGANETSIPSLDSHSRLVGLSYDQIEARFVK